MTTACRRNLTSLNSLTNRVHPVRRVLRQTGHHWQILPRCRTLVHNNLDLFSIFDFRFSILDFRFSISVKEFSNFSKEFSILDFRLSIFDFIFSIFVFDFPEGNFDQ